MYKKYKWYDIICQRKEKVCTNKRNVTYKKGDIGGGNMIKRNGKKIAAIAIAGTLMMQNMNNIFAMENSVENVEKENIEVLSSVSTENKEKTNETVDLEL